MSHRAAVGRRTRVLIVDDHALVRCGVRALIEGLDGFEVCAEAANATSALQIAAAERPDIVTLDVCLPDMRGVEVIPVLMAEAPAVEFLVLTLTESELVLGQALRAGARAYVFKSDPAERLLEALEALARHQPYFSPTISGHLLATLLDAPGAQVGDMLTLRERQVVELVALGRSNRTIGQLLGISLKTVESHRAAAMAKIGARSSADLARYAARNGLIEL